MFQLPRLQNGHNDTGHWGGGKMNVNSDMVWAFMFKDNVYDANLDESWGSGFSFMSPLIVSIKAKMIFLLKN